MALGRHLINKTQFSRPRMQKTQWSCPGSSTQWSPTLVKVIYSFLRLRRYGKQCHLPILINKMNLNYIIWEINSGTKQGGRTMITYYNTLNRLWQESNIYQDNDCKCQEDGKQFKQILEKERVFDFFAGLNLELDQVHSRILREKSLPSVKSI